MQRSEATSGSQRVSDSVCAQIRKLVLIIVDVGGRKTVLRTFLLPFTLLFWRGTPTPGKSVCTVQPKLLNTLFLRAHGGRGGSGFVELRSLIKMAPQPQPEQFKAPVWRAFFQHEVTVLFCQQKGAPFLMDFSEDEWGSLVSEV